MAEATHGAGRRATHSKVVVEAPRAEREVRAVAERLKTLRRARGLTQWAVAERGLSYKYYQRLEAGRANATIRTLARVARALGVPLAELFRPGPDGVGSSRPPRRRR